MSQQVRQKLDDPDRLEALIQTQLMDSPVEEAFDRLTRLASSWLNVPMSLVSLVEPHRQFFKSQVGLSEPLASERQTPISHSFCQHVVTSGEPLIIEDAREHPLVHDNPAIQDLDVVSYLGIPLTGPDGWTLGSFCIIDNKPRVWKESEIQSMRSLADSVMTEINLRLEAKAREEAFAGLQTINKELDAFAHTVSHNLKNPISAIIGWSSLSTQYADKMSNEELLDTVEKMGELASQTNDIINALLLLAGVTRDGGVAVQELNMFNIVDDALSRLLDEITKQKVEIHLPEPDAFPHCLGYRPWIEEVWMNYISNAIKYGGDPPRLEFGADLVADGFVHYWIKDNGPGIPPDELDKLYVPFSRLPQTAMTEGHGLGLSIVERIVSKLGGDVHVTSEFGDGSTFGFTLPASN